MNAVWNGPVLAESDDTVLVEGNYYFPRDAVNKSYLRPSETLTICPWKGTANYYTLEVGGKTNFDAVWYYLDQEDAARQIGDRGAF